MQDKIIKLYYNDVDARFTINEIAVKTKLPKKTDFNLLSIVWQTEKVMT